MKRVTDDGGSSLWMMHRLWRSDASWRKAGKDKVGQARPQKYKCLAMNDFNVESLGKYRTVYQESESDSSCSRSTMKIQISRYSHLSRINCWLHIRDFVVIMSSKIYASLCQQIKFASAGNPSRMKFARVSFSVCVTFSVPRSAREVGWPPAVNCLNLLAVFWHVTIAYFQEAFRIFMTYVRIITLSGIYHPRKSQQGLQDPRARHSLAKITPSDFIGQQAEGFWFIFEYHI